jgi:NNP family nitrate/nitrite transporter-like MFS transporter
VLTIVPLAVGWRFAHTVAHFYTLGLFLGIAGASFAVALPLASRWYPREYQGLAMGIAGAGNSGTLFATLLAPRIAERFGWASAFGFAILPVAAVLLLFALMARDSPRQGAAPSMREYHRVLGESDTLWLAFLYSLTFGGFVGLASFLTTFFNEQYHLSRVTAGDFTTCWDPSIVKQSGVFSYRNIVRRPAAERVA